MKLVDSRQMEALDQRAQTELGLNPLVLMESAARSVLESVRDLLVPGVTAYLFCGTGNNGGDGYALGRLLVNQGFEVVLVSLGSPKTEAAQENARLFRFFGRVLEFEDFLTTLLRPRPQDLIFDAILGTGLKSEILGRVQAAVQWINHAQGHKISLDLPTGINGSTGDEMGLSVQAERTVAFQLEKLGHHLHPGKARRGKLVCQKISIVEEPLETPYHLFDGTQALGLLPPLDPLTYKNRQGHLGLVCGSPGMMGAALLSGLGAIRSGAGLVTLCLPQGEQNALLAAAPELMTCPRESALPERFARFQALGLGCGLGRNPEDWAKYRSWITNFVGPVVLDADAFYGLEGLKGLGPHRLVLTPHVGEFAQMTGWKAPKNNGERIEQARDFAIKEGTTLLLKGAPTLVVNQEGELWVNETGNPGMATAGSGDVLTGVIGALLAQGLPPFDAARLGCWLHGKAGDDFALNHSPQGLTASGLIQGLPDAFGALRPKA